MTDIRPGIVSLLVDTRNLGGPTSKIKHLDGSPLTQDEVRLVCSATWDELIAAWGMKELDESFDPAYPMAAADPDEQDDHLDIMTSGELAGQVKLLARIALGLAATDSAAYDMLRNLSLTADELASRFNEENRP